MSRGFHAAVVAAAALASGCAADLELPAPPDLSPLTALYEEPTAALDSSTAEGVLRDFVDRRRVVEELDDLRPVTGELVRLHDELELGEDEEGLTLRGVPLPVDAHLTLIADCPGIAGEVATDAVELSFVIRSSTLVPVLFGPLHRCELERTVEGRSVPVSMSGELAAQAPNLLDREAPRVVLMVFELSEVDIDGRAVGPRSGHFRLVGGRLEVVVELGSDGHLIAFRDRDQRIGIRAQNGEWSCSREERTCERAGEPPDSFGF